MIKPLAALRDMLLGSASPEPTVNKVRVNSTRKYKAANQDRLTGFSTGYWVGYREENRRDILGLVNHSRHLAKNNPYMKQYLGMVRRHILGPTGIVLQADFKDRRGDRDREDNRRVERAFREWGKKGNCTVCGRYTFKQVQRQTVTMAARDGLCLVREYRGRGFGPFAFQVQVLPVELLDIDLNKELGNGSYIHGGIEFNRFDKPLAYWLFDNSERVHGQRLMTHKRIRVPADEIHLVTRKDDGDAFFSVPWVFAAARELNMIGGYQEAALTAARAGASKMGFLKANADAIEAVTSNAGELTTSQLLRDGDLNLGDPELEELEAGTVETLPIGYEFQGFDPGYPDAQIEPFLKTMLRSAAAGFEVSYSGLSNDYEGANFSSLRRGSQEERDEWRMLQDWHVDDFEDPLYLSWLRMFLISDWNAQNDRLPFNLAKYSQIKWQRRGWESVNPVDDAQADNLNIAAGRDSPQRAAARRGADFETVIDEIAEAQEIAREKDVSLSFVTSLTQSQTVEQQEGQADAT